MWVFGRSQTVVVSAYRSDDRPRRMTLVVEVKVMVYCVIRGDWAPVGKEKGLGRCGCLGFERDLITMMLRMRETINRPTMARAHPVSTVSPGIPAIFRMRVVQAAHWD